MTQSSRAQRSSSNNGYIQLTSNDPKPVPLIDQFTATGQRNYQYSLLGNNQLIQTSIDKVGRVSPTQ